MNLIVILSILLSSIVSNAQGYCNPERSKPCGNGCISLNKTCRTSWTTMKVGINPNKSSKKGYDKPQFVEKAPTE